jgi:hypothetical protein
MLKDIFDIEHIKERYRKQIADRSISIHATLAEMLGTGMVVLIGTSTIQMTGDMAARMTVNRTFSLRCRV